MPVILDTSFYIDRLKRKLPAEILEFVNARSVKHSAVACGELAVSVGILTPGHPTTPAYRDPILTLLGTIDVADTVAPSAAAWSEAGIVSGILARTQHLNRSKKELAEAEACCQEGKRRKLLNDALIFFSAIEAVAILVTANVRDMDVLLRMKPNAQVLLYRPLPRPESDGPVLNPDTARQDGV
jgi:predicted nucleic acid-binding protein